MAKQPIDSSSPIGEGCLACDDREKFRFLCPYHRGWSDGWDASQRNAFNVLVRISDELESFSSDNGDDIDLRIERLKILVSDEILGTLPV